MLMPSTSTAVMLAMGEALAFAGSQQEAREGSEPIWSPPVEREQGRYTSVAKLMCDLHDTVLVTGETPVSEVIGLITEKGCSAAMIVDDHGVLVGIFTDGDLRRLLSSRSTLNVEQPISCAMTSEPLFVHETCLANSALEVMREKQITGIPVVDSNRSVLGYLELRMML